MLAAEYPEFMKTNVKMISGQRGRAAGAPPRGRQILHFLSDQTAPRPALPWPGGILQPDYFPIFGSIGKPDILPPFIHQSLAHWKNFLL